MFLPHNVRIRSKGGSTKLQMKTRTRPGNLMSTTGLSSVTYIGLPPPKTASQLGLASLIYHLDSSINPSLPAPASSLRTPLPPQSYSRPTDLALPDDRQEVLGRGEVGHVQHVGEAGDHLHLVEHGPLGGRGHHQQPPALGGHLVDAYG